VKSLQLANGFFQLPIRLLEVSNGSGGVRLALRESSHLPPATRYVTLSRCWGKEAMIRLLQSNLREFLTSISFSCLSKTFREAMEFTLHIGLRYLWIDALCIIQDSEDDWSHEAMLTSSVYTNSYLNLAATSSRNGSGGLFVAQNPLLANRCSIEAKWEGFMFGRYTCFDGIASRRRIAGAPLNKRASVLRERLLAPQVVHFAYDQVWWECLQMRACESFPTGIRKERSPIVSDAATSFWNLCSETSTENWLNMVESYTKCGHTKHEDKLDAIAGVSAPNTPAEKPGLVGLYSLCGVHLGQI
jgi:hypothetical protein